MNELAKPALNALIEQQKTTLDLLIKKQLEISELAFKVYPNNSRNCYEATEKLININDCLYKARRDYQHAAEALEKIEVPE